MGKEFLIQLRKGPACRLDIPLLRGLFVARVEEGVDHDRGEQDNAPYQILQCVADIQDSHSIDEDRDKGGSVRNPRDPEHRFQTIVSTRSTRS